MYTCTRCTVHMYRMYIHHIGVAHRNQTTSKWAGREATAAQMTSPIGNGSGMICQCLMCKADTPFFPLSPVFLLLGLSRSGRPPSPEWPARQRLTAPPSHPIPSHPIPSHPIPSAPVGRPPGRVSPSRLVLLSRVVGVSDSLPRLFWYLIPVWLARLALPLPLCLPACVPTGLSGPRACDPPLLLLRLFPFHPQHTLLSSTSHSTSPLLSLSLPSLSSSSSSSFLQTTSFSSSSSFYFFFTEEVSRSLLPLCVPPLPALVPARLFSLAPPTSSHNHLTTRILHRTRKKRVAHLDWLGKNRAKG
jgi:hypothetical protein